MPNLLIDTRLSRSEGDRLTNALMALLEHSNPSVLAAFLELAAHDDAELGPDDILRFELQPAFDESRPDAAIVARHHTVYIETKRGDVLDDDQFRRHWNHLAEQHENSTLVALTGRHVAPGIVHRLNDQAERVQTAHVSWSEWLGKVVRMQEQFGESTATGLLLRQFEEYLRSLGYWHFDGPPSDRVLDLGDTLRRYWRRHQDTTRPYLRQRFEVLARKLEEQLPEDGAWDVNEWGKRGNFRQGFGLIYAENVRHELGPKTRFRLSIVLSEENQLHLYRYLTILHTEDHFDALGNWLLERRDRLEEFAPFRRFGFFRPGELFQCSIPVPNGHLTGFLDGDEECTNAIAVTSGDFFMVLQDLLAAYMS